MGLTPDPTPGCLVVWQDGIDNFHIALVVSVDCLPGAECFGLRVIEGSRLHDVFTYRCDRGIRWRVLHEA